MKIKIRGFIFRDNMTIPITHMVSIPNNKTNDEIWFWIQDILRNADIEYHLITWDKEIE